jgi:Tol biopolymer transport system component
MDIYRRTASLSYPTLYRVTNDAAYDKNPTFAPNSHSIIIASDRDKANTPGFDLYRLNAFGAVEKRLTQTGDYSESGAAFSANGAKMVYHRRSHGALYEDNVVLTDELMTSPQTIWAAITREMDSPTLSADGSYVMVKMNSGGSRGLFRARTWGADKQVTRITPVGEEWIMPGWTN